MRRRDFVTLLGGSAIAWPLAVHAQQRAMPVIGYLGIRSAESDASRLTGLRRGLNETGYVEGRNSVEPPSKRHSFATSKFGTVSETATGESVAMTTIGR